MSEDTKVVSLLEERAKRNHQAGHDAHERGEAFMFQPFEFDEERSVGVIDTDETKMDIVIITDTENISGVCMTRADAKRLGESLIEASKAELPKDSEG